MPDRTAAPIDVLLQSLADRAIFELGHVLQQGMPVSPNHPPFQMALLRRHGDVLRPDGGSAANELITTGGHTGTHVDALAHVSQDGMLYGAVPAKTIEGAHGFRRLGVDTMSPILCRGVLLDIAAVLGVSALDPGYEVTVGDLEAAERLTGLAVGAGDAALIRTGWSSYFQDADRFIGMKSGTPGPGPEAAQWLADRKVRVAGAETIAFEVTRPGAGHRTLPAHRILLVENGINIIEVMDLSTMAAAECYGAMFIALPLRIRGATGSPIRPVAIGP